MIDGVGCPEIVRQHGSHQYRLEQLHEFGCAPLLPGYIEFRSSFQLLKQQLAEAPSPPTRPRKLQEPRRDPIYSLACDSTLT